MLAVVLCLIKEIAVTNVSMPLSNSPRFASVIALWMAVLATAWFRLIDSMSCSFNPAVCNGTPVTGSTGGAASWGINAGLIWGATPGRGGKGCIGPPTEFGWGGMGPGTTPGTPP